MNMKVLECLCVLYLFAPCFSVDLPKFVSASTNSRRSEGALITHEGEALQGHANEYLQAPSLISCTHDCLKRTWCISLNYDFHGDSLSCEMNDFGVENQLGVSEDEKANFMSRKDFLYSQIRRRKDGSSFCSNSPCDHGAICDEESKSCVSTTGSMPTPVMGDRSTALVTNTALPAGITNTTSALLAVGSISTTSFVASDNSAVAATKNSSATLVNGPTPTLLAAGSISPTSLVTGASSAVAATDSSSTTPITGTSLATTVSTPAPDLMADFPRALHRHYIKLNNQISVMTAFTVSLWMISVPQTGSKAQALISIATARDPNALTIMPRNSKINYKVGKDIRNVERSVLDGQWHHICATWANTAGNWTFFIDGTLAADGTGYSISYTYTDAKVVLGQDIDDYDDISNVDDVQSFLGTLTGVNIWDFVKTTLEIGNLYSNCTTFASGNVFKWGDLTTSTTVNGSIQFITGVPCG